MAGFVFNVARDRHGFVKGQRIHLPHFDCTVEVDDIQKVDNEVVLTVHVVQEQSDSQEG